MPSYWLHPSPHAIANPAPHRGADSGDYCADCVTNGVAVTSADLYAVSGPQQQPDSADAAVCTNLV